MGNTAAKTSCSKGECENVDEKPLYAPEADEDVLVVGMARGSGSRSSSSGVERKDISKMSRSETARFVKCLKRMQTNGSYFELAGIHGWPTNRKGAEYGFCEHRVERFCGWHRVYLAQFERALQRADRETGGNGRIGLPYWDWSNNRRIPSFMRDFQSVPASSMPSRYRGGTGLPSNKRQRYFNRNNDMVLRHDNVSVSERQLHDLYRLSFFPNFATKQRASPGGFRDIESIHDEVHVDCGGIMADLDLAAFSPLFWIHHANIDRIYETYLYYEPDSSREMSRNEYGTSLKPWGASTSRTFQAIGYHYEHLAHEMVPGSVKNHNNSNVKMFHSGAQPSNPSNQTVTGLGEHSEYASNPTRFEPNTNVVFQVDVRKLTDNSYELVIFGVPHGEQLDVNVNQPERWRTSRWFLANSGILFSREVAACANCQKNHTFEMHVPIQNGLKRIGKSRNQVKVQVFFKGNYGGTYTHQQMYQTGKLGGHSVRGPFFGDSHDIKHGDRTNDTAQLQRYLFKYGWYDGKIDGVFSEKTKTGCLGFQQFYGLKQDSVCGAKTKQFIISKFRIDDEPDNNGDVRRYNKRVVTYKVMSSPAYLNRDGLLREVDRAFDQWERPTGMRFDRAQPNAQADIEIRWQSHFKYDIMYGEGVGGLLSRSDNKTIILNGQEKWMLLNSPIPRLGGFYLYNVMLHQAGKIIGLSNVGDPDDVMYPYYNATKTTLSEDDVHAAQSLYHRGQALQRPHPRQNSNPTIERMEIHPCGQDTYSKQRGQADKYRPKKGRGSYSQTKPSYGPGPQPPPSGGYAMPVAKPVPQQPKYTFAPQPQVNQQYGSFPAYSKPAPMPAPVYNPAPVYSHAPVMMEEKAPEVIAFDGRQPAFPCGPCGQAAPCGNTTSMEVSRVFSNADPTSGAQPAGPPVTQPVFDAALDVQSALPPCPSPEDCAPQDSEVLTNEQTPDFRPKLRAEPVFDDAAFIQDSLANDPRIANLGAPIEQAEYSLECWVDANGKETCVKKFTSPSGGYQQPSMQPAPISFPAPVENYQAAAANYQHAEPIVYQAGPSQFPARFSQC